MFLSNCAMPKAVEYILQHFDQIPNMDELLQMSIIEVIKLDCKRDSIHRVCESKLFVVLALTSTTAAAIYPSDIRATELLVAFREIRSGQYSYLADSESSRGQGSVYPVLSSSTNLIPPY